MISIQGRANYRNIRDYDLRTRFKLNSAQLVVRDFSIRKIKAVEAKGCKLHRLLMLLTNL